MRPFVLAVWTALALGSIAGGGPALAQSAPAAADAASSIEGVVVDAGSGLPLPGATIAVVEGGAARATTDGTGRFRLDGLAAGVYRLLFDTAGYFSAQKVEGLYPVIHITFAVRDGESQFHIPLLLAPNGYTTYRGS